MSDVYKRLAMKLDQMPNTFPPTESGVELKILRKIFAPDEAEMALNLEPVPATVEAIAELKVIGVEEVLEAVSRNFRGLYGALKGIK